MMMMMMMNFLVSPATASVKLQKRTFLIPRTSFAYNLLSLACKVFTTNQPTY